MNRKPRPDERTVRRCARPINIRNGHRRVVLCLHGFTGYPGEMAYPADRLSEAGWDVRVPRLHGHGTDGADFSGTAMNMITRQVRDEWLDLSAAYDEVFVLGHSMGGLLTLSLAGRYPVQRAAVMAPAIGLRVRGQFPLGPISLFFPRVPFKWEPDPRYTFFDDRDEDDDLFLGGEYWSWSWLRQLSQLQRIMRQTERNLARITTPILGVFAENDTVVGEAGKPILEKGLGGEFKEVRLEQSGHYIPYDFTPGVKEAAMDAVVDWFRQGVPR